MRLFEILLCVFSFCIAVGMLLGLSSPSIQAAALLLLATLTAHLVWEGVHWQLLPAYAAAFLVLACVAIEMKSPAAGRHVWVAVASLVLLAAAGLASYLMPMFRLPQPTGPHAVGTRLLYVVDSSRKDEHGLSPTGKRELMVQLWYPARPERNRLACYRRRSETTLRSSYQAVLRTHSYQDAAVLPDGAPFPLLLFNPAWTGQRTQSTFLMEELASQGFVVASVDHTYYGGLIAFPDGRIVDSRLAPEIGSFENSSVAEQSALGDKYTRIEAEDDISVLNELQLLNDDPSSPWFRRLDMQRVGALGHSLGGAAAAEAALLDRRIRAALNMDGWMFGDAGRVGLGKPLMLMYEDESRSKANDLRLTSGTPADRMYWQLSADDTARMDASLRANGGYRMYLRGGAHTNFCDRPLYSPLRSWTGAGEIPARRAYAIINAYAVAFFSHVLKGTDEPLLEQIPSGYPEVNAERWTAR